MTTIVKIGSESLMHFEVLPKVNALVRDISELIQKYNENVLLVTSGAVYFGRKVAPQITDKHILAAIGTSPLFAAYDKKFQDCGVTTGTILATHSDIEDNPHRRNRLRETISEMWNYKILPIVNENDAISAEEMNEVPRGADNDMNALLLAKIFQAKNLIILSNTNGVLADINNPESRIPEIFSENLTDEYIRKLCGEEKSQSGTGGMQSKLRVARESANREITTHLINGVDSTILDAYLGKNTGGTKIFSK